MKTWTVGTAWYLCLPIFDKAAVKIKRSTFYKYIKDLCDEAGITRAAIGIITGVRAELYFAGEWSSVSLDGIEDLARKGTDVVFIEKQGVPEIIKEWADKYGIALVNTRGKLVEYAKDLMNAIDAFGGHVVIMTDYDASGVKIASECPTEIPWIGANDEMLEYLKIDRNSVAVSSIAKWNKDYVKYLVENGCHPEGDYKRSGEEDDRFTGVDVEFLDKRRVELDAILAKVGDERFFEYIKHALEELNLERDYNRAIPVTTIGLEVKHKHAMHVIAGKITVMTKAETDKIKKELRNVEGFLDVNEKLGEIKERLAAVFNDNPDYVDFTEKLNELVNSHPFFKKQESAGSK